ncbi:MAG: hypothetical protein V1770_02995 [bacterium]
MKKIFKNILDFIFPIECVGCGEELHTPSGQDAGDRHTPNLSQEGKQWLCDYCFSKIEFNKKQICPLCGREMETGYSCVCTVQMVSSIKYQVSSYVDVYVTFVDLKKNPQVAKLIYKLKYNFVEDAAKDLARIGMEFLKRNWKLDPSDERGARIRNLLFNENVLFVPVPLHRKRLLWRGFNQSEAILREMGREGEQKLEIRNWKLEIRNDLLIRKKNTFFQGKSKMAEAGRRENMRGAFEARRYGAISNFNPASSAGQISKQFLISNFQFLKRMRVKCDNNSELKDWLFLKNKTIVLFDDVITTGATMEECARVLKMAGASRVIAMAVGKG